MEMGLIERSNLALRKKIIRGYLVCLPLAAFGIYYFVTDFVILIMVGGLTSAIFLPIQAGATLWLQRTRMDPRIRPRRLTYVGLWVVFAFEAAMALLVIRYVVLAPYFN
jgi:hypothetical protein